MSGKRFSEHRDISRVGRSGLGFWGGLGLGCKYSTRFAGSAVPSSQSLRHSKEAQAMAMRTFE